MNIYELLRYDTDKHVYTTTTITIHTPIRREYSIYGKHKVDGYLEMHCGDNTRCYIWYTPSSTPNCQYATYYIINPTGD